MIRMTIDGVTATATEKEVLTAGRVGLRCAFEFVGGEWGDLFKTAVFQGIETVDVALPTNECVVPWEAMAVEGVQLKVGVYGANGNGDIVIPTVWANFGKIQPSAVPSGVDPATPSQNANAYAVETAEQALAVAQSVRTDADNHVFDGATGPQGPEGPQGPTGPQGPEGPVTLVNAVVDDNSYEEVFWCTDSTTWAEIIAALNANLLPLKKDSAGRILTYLKKSGNDLIFAAVDGANLEMEVRDLSGWTPETYLLGTYRKPSGGIPTADLADGAVTSAKLASYAVKGINIENGTIDRGKLDADANDIFWAEYGTTYPVKIADEVTIGGKLPACLYNNRVYVHVKYVPGSPDDRTSKHYFSSLDSDGTMYYLVCEVVSSVLTWTNGSIDLTSGGGGGTSDYTQLSNKPSINSITLDGSLSLADIGITSPSAEIVYCTYGTTTSAQIEAMLTAGQLPAVIYNDVLYVYSYKSSATKHYFGSTGLSSLAYRYLVEDNGAWSAASLPLVPADVTISAAGSVSQTLDANKVYHFTGALTALTIAANAAPAGVAAFYHFDFDIGSTAFTPSLPVTWKMPSVTYAANTHYEIDVQNNYGVVQSWATS